MKTFHGEYRHHFGWGAYEYIDVLVVANTESEALGFALTDYPQTHASSWTIYGINTDEVGTHFISERSS